MYLLSLNGELFSYHSLRKFVTPVIDIWDMGLCQNQPFIQFKRTMPSKQSLFSTHRSSHKWAYVEYDCDDKGKLTVMKFVYFILFLLHSFIQFSLIFYGKCLLCIPDVVSNPNRMHIYPFAAVILFASIIWCNSSSKDQGNTISSYISYFKM